VRVKDFTLMRLKPSPSLHALLVLCLIPVAAVAQQQKSRPKIGVAFEGGGALGLAHIGVLEWFEEHRIPVDYIAGTSMGGLVGGMYATGLRVNELKELVSKLEWDKILSGLPQYRNLAYRRKEDLVEFQNYLDFGWNKGIAAPGGLNSGQDVSYVIDRIALPYGDGSFDNLPIPFRCVATDLSTGNVHVFDSGSLDVALRSTMSLPAIFSPVKRDAAIYADGGLLNNLPVVVVKRMGADIVIALYLSGEPFDPKTSQSLFSVMGRSIGVMIAANEAHNMEAADLLISADLGKFSAMSYNDGEKIIQKGYEGAEKKSAMLTTLALDQASWDEHLKQREARRRRTPPPPQYIAVEGVKGAEAKDIEKSLSDHVGKPVDATKLERDLDLISGNRRFSSFSYRQTQMNGQSGLTVYADPRENAPPFVKIGVSLDGADPDNVLFTTFARVTVMDKFGYGSEWRTDVGIGSTWQLASELYKPLSLKTGWFVAPRMYLLNQPFNVYNRGNQIADYRLYQYGGAFDFGYAIDRFSQLRFGYDAAYFRSSIRVGFPALPTPSGRIGESLLRYDRDTRDNPVVPRSGNQIDLRAGWTDASPGAPTGFPLAELHILTVHRINEPGSIFLNAYGGSTFGHSHTGLPQFFLGGPQRLTAYGVNELWTNQYFLGQLGYIRQLFSLPPLIGNKAYVIAEYELGKTYGSPTAIPVISSSRLPMDGTASMVFDTLFGPLAIGASYGDSGHRGWYFRLGRIF
jgi:NTE family protein